jgi:hypothetical protein
MEADALMRHWWHWQIGGSALLAVAWLVTLGLSLAPPSSPLPSKRSQPSTAPTTDAPLPASARLPEPLATLERQFATEFWALFRQTGCLTCHGKKNPSPLELPQNPFAAFRTLLEHDYFRTDTPSGLVGRIAMTDPQKRMPPEPFPAWSEQDIQRLTNFCEQVNIALRQLGIKPDEVFPFSLLLPYDGAKPTAGMDNTFLSYYQLRQKVKTIFGDEWRRNERDLFAENIALFGGADFHRYFSETNRPTAQYLTGLDMLARDVASLAYLNNSGPFRDFPENLPDPTKLKAPDAAYRRAINLLYNRLLFRDATEQEIRQAFQFLQTVYREGRNLTPDFYDLQFELTVEDEQGMKTTRTIALTVLNTPYALTQEFVDETQADKDGIGRHTLSRIFTFKRQGGTGDAGRGTDDGQCVRISNAGTYGVVSVVGIELRGPLPKETVKRINATDNGAAELQGAWRKAGDAYHDNDENKGSSHIIFPIRVDEDGQYQVTVLYRVFPNRYMAKAVPVEVLSHDGQHQLTLPPASPTPPKGEAHFTVDQTVDTIPYWDSKTAFRFSDPTQGVEISNKGTLRQVVADAVRFVPLKGGEPLLVRANEAEGNEQWQEFEHGAFKAYNTIGPKLLSDRNQRKGELRLLYKPSVRKEWKPDEFYFVHITYPAKAGNETQTPVTIRAAASSPIVRVRYPVRAHVGATVTLDASGSYNVQQTPLRFTWRQIGGPKVRLDNPHRPTVTFVAPHLTPHQAAWEGLCRALMKHPDFLFTRPPSLAVIKDERQRRRLQLVKIAQDLVGRPPTEQELMRIDKGASLAQLVDDYLNSAEFREFYFRRIRLLLESHGTEEDDEPVRLWCYVAFNDRPFQEILTADYTVDTNWQRKERPAYHGKTGLLTMKGFIKGKPGLPHFNYAAIVAEKFLGYVFEVPPEIVEARQTATAAATTQPGSVCYSCHKLLTPLAYQRLRWTDDGQYREKDEKGNPIDDSDRNEVAWYPFKGRGMEAFATQAVKKERFIRTMIDTHFLFFFGRGMRWDKDERTLYKRLWDAVHRTNFTIKGLIKAIVLSPEYLNGGVDLAPAQPSPAEMRRRTAQWHQRWQWLIASLQKGDGR